MMHRNFRSRSRDAQHSRPGGRFNGGGRQGGRPNGRGRPQNSRANGQRRNAGPKLCPMCGSTVINLADHIRDNHDDAESHPCD